jgi:hypothetical protein
MLAGLIAVIWVALAVLVCLGVCAAAARPTPKSEVMETPHVQIRANTKFRCSGALAKGAVHVVGCARSGCIRSLLRFDGREAREWLQ